MMEAKTTLTGNVNHFPSITWHHLHINHGYFEGSFESGIQAEISKLPEGVTLEKKNLSETYSFDSPAQTQLGKLFDSDMSYYANPFENYYKTGSGYYGGSYTGGSGGDNNEPPFGWSSVFDESNRRRVYTTRVRPFRILSIILTFVLFSMFVRCVLYSCLISPLYGCYGSADRTQSRSMNSSSESVSQDWIRIGD